MSSTKRQSSRVKKRKLEEEKALERAKELASKARKKMKGAVPTAIKELKGKAGYRPGQANTSPHREQR